MDKTRDWGVRIAHEATLHDQCSFLTLTYNDESLPQNYSLDLRELQLFVKRLRKAIWPTRIRFFACGEYGDLHLRPHYHVIIFGYGFSDKTLWRKTDRGFLTYISPLLASLWPLGHSEIGTVNSKSGAYVARYALKKITGPPAGSHYQRLHPVTGQVCDVKPEFVTMSTKPGIGSGWFENWERDCFPSNFVMVDGEKMPVPKYYAKKLKDRNTSTFWEVDDYERTGIQNRGRKWIRDHAEDLSEDRLATREELRQIKQAKITRDG